MHNPTLRVLQVLELLCKSGGPLRLSDISRELDIPKSTLLPILQTMAQQRYVEKDHSERYTPGFALLDICAAAKSVFSPEEHIKSNLKNLVEAFEETCYYGVLEEGKVLYLEKIDSPQPLRMLTAIGHRLPAYATGIGKALLMDKSFEQLKALYGDKLPPLTANTLKDVKSLYRQLQQAGELGFTWEAEESTEHIRCFAVPVRKDGEITGAVSIAIPVFRYKPEKQQDIINALKNTAEKIEAGFHLLA